MNHVRPRPEAIAQHESVTAASNKETTHITASCGPAGSVGSMNCGRNAVKNTMVFGFDNATKNPRVNCTEAPVGSTLAAPACRHACTPSQIR